MTELAILALEDGTLFEGCSIGVHGQTTGEVVFNTAMTGYQEVITDPSYARQIVTLTYPHIGNTGINCEDSESGMVHAAGLVIRDLPPLLSNWRSDRSLTKFLADNNMVAIADIDTRRLTRLLREGGAQNGCIATGNDLDQNSVIEQARSFPGLKGMDLASVVSTSEVYAWDDGGWGLSGGFRDAPPQSLRVVAYDFGIKHNILRMLVDRGCHITVVPAKTPAKDVLSLQPHGVFLSNGPGDPEPCVYAISAIHEIVETGMPVFGICLGHQLLCLAAGAKTTKMKFGHHGVNHPVQDLDSNQVLITSQNHGFAVEAAGMPANLRITHKSLFDGSVQGVERLDRPAFSFQGHPEASPGPHDVANLFDRFVRVMRTHHGMHKSESAVHYA